MSVCSNASDISVSINGYEIPVDIAIDDTFKGIQRSVNDSQCTLRSLIQLIEQDKDYKTSLEYSFEILDHIDTMNMLFKDLKTIVKQVQIKPQDNEEKEILKQFMEERRIKKEKEKQEMKNM
jgi:hypothetical protein